MLIDLLPLFTPAPNRDLTAPVISNITPTPNTAIPKFSLLGCDVTDNVALLRVVINVRFDELGTNEVAHDGTAFSLLYAAGSTRTPISGGFRYALERRGGWPASPTLWVDPIDTSGNEG